MKKLLTLILVMLGVATNIYAVGAEEIEDEPPNSDTLGSEPVELEERFLEGEIPLDLDPVSLEDSDLLKTSPVFGGTQYELTLEEVRSEEGDWSHGVFYDETYLQQELRERNGLFIKNSF